MRRSGVPVHHGSIEELAGRAELAKGLELDLVVIVDPETLTPVDRYVAMTRATQRLVVLER